MPTTTRPKAVITHERGSTSSVERALRVLRVMSEGGGVRLTDIAAAADLDKATALRLLDVMAREGFVTRDAVSKQFTLGPELTVLGAAACWFDPRPLARHSLMRLAGVFQDTVVLSMRSGVESLCIDVEEGTYPIRANYLTVGSLRPLGVGAGSLALLAWMPTTNARRRWRRSQANWSATRASPPRYCANALPRRASAATPCCWMWWWSAWVASVWPFSIPRAAGGCAEHRFPQRAHPDPRSRTGPCPGARSHGVPGALGRGHASGPPHPSHYQEKN